MTITLARVPWWVCNAIEEVDDPFYMFEELCKDAINECIMMRMAKIRAKDPLWVNRDIKSHKGISGKKRNNLILKQKCQEIRNNVTKIMRGGESKYFTSTDF